MYKKWNDLSKTTEVMDKSDDCSIKNLCFKTLQGLRAHVTSNHRGELHFAMKQYMEDVYSSTHIDILNEHVSNVLNQRRKCGYSMKSQGVGNQSKKNTSHKLNQHECICFSC